MKYFIKERIERYLQYLSDDNTEKTSRKLWEVMSWEMRRMQMEQCTLNSKEEGIANTDYLHYGQVIVSLTTYGERLYEVFLAIESIMQQTVKPNKIILWLQEDMKDIVLPVTIQKQVDRGLEIGYCKDIRSYKKLIPTLQKYPNDIIVTIDDDIIFSMDMLENLLVSYQKVPECIHTNRAHVMKYTPDGKLDKYMNWELDTKKIGMFPHCFPTGGAGTLYPPHSLSEEVLNEEVFMKLCPKADDVWFKAMSLKNDKLCCRAYTHEPYMVFNPTVQEISLWKENIHENDIQIQKVFEHYNLFDKLQ